MSLSDSLFLVYGNAIGFCVSCILQMYWAYILVLIVVDIFGIFYTDGLWTNVSLNCTRPHGLFSINVQKSMCKSCIEVDSLFLHRHQWHLI